MKLTVGIKQADAEGSMGVRMTKLVLHISGRKGFVQNGTVYRFEPTQRNVDKFLEIYPETELFDNRETERALKMNAAAGVITFKKHARPAYKQVKPDYGHQTRAHEKVDHLKLSALFMGTGTGKTKVALDKSLKHYCAGEIDCIVVITLKGVHTQWVDEQVPTHVHESIPKICHAWRGMKTVTEKRQFEFFIKQEKLQIFTINVDAFRGDKAYNTLKRLLARHRGRVMCIVDESQEIATFDSERSRTIQEFGTLVEYKMIMSGTPIPKNLVNEWSQFLFLSEDIIGEKYVTSFRKDYCIMGGFQDAQVVGHKNLERFNKLVAPYIFRVTKESELDLPPKVYTRHVFDMTDEQHKHYESLRKNFITKLANGSVATVANAAVLVMRLQQISNGYLTDEDGTIHPFERNPRFDALKGIDKRIDGKKIVWAHYNRDVDMLAEHFGDRCVKYVGSTSTKERDYAKSAFMDPDSGKDIFLSNPAAGGTGLNLQGECATAIYYNNSFNAVHRWQSEDRIHRIGTYKTITYVDLVAAKSVDYRILSNLRKKKDFQELVLDDIRIMMEELGELEEQTIVHDLENIKAEEWDGNWMQDADAARDAIYEQEYALGVKDDTDRAADDDFMNHFGLK